jgi:hypothetical protein
MSPNRSIAAALTFVCAIAGWIVVGAGQQLPLQPTREKGASVTGAFEGWYPNSDGTFTLLIGYYNRNRNEILDIPVGPDNRIEPGGPDRGQPTHFLPRRQWGVFTITVPKDFGTKKLTWTLRANGETTEIPFSLNVKYQVEPFRDLAMGNTPPIVKFQESGPALTGPPRGIAASFTAAAGQPLSFPIWVSDKPGTSTQETGGGGPGPAGRGPAPPATLTLVKHRGPGEIKFAEARPKIDFAAGGRATATATFSAPGDYIVRVQANDASGEGGGGFQCCWTNAHVRVTVK